MRHSYRLWLIALCLLSCSGCLRLGSTKSTPTPVQTKRLPLVCELVSGIDPMQLCERAPRANVENCPAVYVHADEVARIASFCWAAHRALVECVTRHNEGAE